jgi:Circularly permutated YpsA SLOG family
MIRKIISGGQTGADRAGLEFAIETELEHGGYVPRGRKAEDGRIDERYNLVELSTSSYPARTRRNIEERFGENSCPGAAAHNETKPRKRN